MHVTLPEVVAAVKAAPMTIPVKEAILVQLVGHPDDLHGKKDARCPRRSLAERTVEASRIGAFDRLRVEDSGDEVYAYYKRGVLAYELTVRDGVPVHCGCEDFARKVRLVPDYQCKHGCLFLTMWEGLEALVEASGEAAKAYMVARQRVRLGQGRAEEVQAALDRLREVEARIACFLPDGVSPAGSEPSATRRAEPETKTKPETRMAVAA